MMVHLFEWKWSDIAAECERFLAPNGYAGVQISPPNENFLESVNNRPWSERYQPMSYKLITRSGNEAAFVDMTRRCNAVGVRIYADIIVNHMSGMTGYGTGGSYGNAETGDFPGVPYTSNDFNLPRCEIVWWDAASIRNCEIYGLRDINQSRENVRTAIAGYLNHLIDLGVAGFRFDIMKHMWPQDLENIWARMKNLNVNYGFASNSRPFVVGEVYDDGFVNGKEYFHLGTTTEFKYPNAIAKSFRGQDQLKWLQNFGEGWGFHPSNLVLSFVTNHDTQREGLFSYKEGRLYRMAVAFHLAFPYGIPRIMSSFAFESRSQGPPHDGNYNTLSPTFNADGSCNNGWVCEHRWQQTVNMVSFRNTVEGTTLANWWDNGDNQIAFARGSRGFIAFNGQYRVDLNVNLQTGLPAGVYCDLASGSKQGTICTGTIVTVTANGFASIYLSSEAAEGYVAIHVDARL